MWTGPVLGRQYDSKLSLQSLCLEYRQPESGEYLVYLFYFRVDMFTICYHDSVSFGANAELYRGPVIICPKCTDARRTDIPIRSWNPPQ